MRVYCAFQEWVKVHVHVDGLITFFPAALKAMNKGVQYMYVVPFIEIDTKLKSNLP